MTRNSRGGTGNDFADRNPVGAYRSDDQSGRRRMYDSQADARDYHVLNRREAQDDAGRYYGDDESDFRDRPGFGNRSEDDGRRARGLTPIQDHRERWRGAARSAPDRPDLNDRQNGWHNGPRVDRPNDDRVRDSWRGQDRNDR